MASNTNATYGNSGANAERASSNSSAAGTGSKTSLANSNTVIPPAPVAVIPEIIERPRLSSKSNDEEIMKEVVSITVHYTLL
jgi:hypothetical protein